jgi:Na+-driven multidrug efflux pump
MTTIAEIFARPLASIFVSYDLELLDMTTRAIRIYALSYIIAGINNFTSSFFTALNNGLVSAILSFLRLFLFQAVTVIVMPLFMDLDGIWLSSTASEIMAIITTFIFILALRKRYKY